MARFLVRSWKDEAAVRIGGSNNERLDTVFTFAKIPGVS
jgi:hypothetical protein